MIQVQIRLLERDLWESADELWANSKLTAAVKSLDFEEADIVVPNQDILRRYDDQFKYVFGLVWNLQRQNQFLKEARDILPPRLMTGMIDWRN